MTPAATPDAPPAQGGHRYTTAQRRLKVLYVVQWHGTNAPTDIQRIIEDEFRVRVARQSIHSDLKYLKLNHKKWSLAMSMISWPLKIEQMYREKNEEIADLRRLRRELLDVDREPDPRLAEILADYGGDAAERDDIIRRLRGVYASAAAGKVAGKIAYIDTVLEEKRESLIAMMTDGPLYESGQKLAEFYAAHKET